MHESASHHFACTLPAQPRQTWRFQPGNQIQTACTAQTAWPGPTRLASYRKRYASCCKDESLEISCTYWWGVTLRVIESMFLSGADVRRQANVTCHLYLSTKCVKMCMFNWFAISHHFNQFQLQTWSFVCFWFVQDTRRTYFICGIHIFEHSTILHI